MPVAHEHQQISPCEDRAQRKVTHNILAPKDAQARPDVPFEEVREAERDKNVPVPNPRVLIKCGDVVPGDLVVHTGSVAAAEHIDVVAASREGAGSEHHGALRATEAPFPRHPPVDGHAACRERDVEGGQLLANGAIGNGDHHRYTLLPAPPRCQRRWQEGFHTPRCVATPLTRAAGPALPGRKVRRATASPNAAFRRYCAAP